MGRDLRQLVESSKWISFNPRARMGRDCAMSVTTRFISAFQSTRPHGARPPAAAAGPCPARVSIHAPAWGATSNHCRASAIVSFQSTRPHGARPGLRALQQWVYQCFNPRARMGRDAGARSRKPPSSRFQSTRPHGARRLPASSGEDSSKFQSTRPHGARPSCKAKSPPCARFQSTRPHGARLGGESKSAPLGAFQSTRPHGARLLSPCSFHTSPRFQSTRPHGARQGLRQHLLGRGVVSIHAPAWGATPDPAGA